MKFKSLFLSAMCALAISASLTSCGNDNDDPTPVPNPDPTPAVDTRIVGFLNEGSYGTNNACVSIFDHNKWTKDKSTGLLKNIGDVANDVLVAQNGDIYVTLSTSKTLGIVEYNVTSNVEEISFAEHKLDYQPRYLAEKDGYLYISCYGGYILKMNEKTYEQQTLKLEGGANLEGITILDNTLYVCNSYSVDEAYNYTYLNELITVDLTTFTQSKSLFIPVNPNYITTLNGRIYVVSFGNYNDEPYYLSTLTPNNTTPVVLGNASKMCEWNGKILACYSETDWSNYPDTKTVTTFTKYDGLGIDNKSPLTNMPEELASATIYMMQEDPDSHELYIGTTDYKTNSTIYHFDADGKYIEKFDSQGINCNKAFFLNKK